MHQKKFEPPESIGVGNRRSHPISSDFNLFSSQIDRFQSTPPARKPHLTVQIPPTSLNPPSTQTHHHYQHHQQLKIQQTHLPSHEFFSNISSPTHALHSTPHKRMTQTLSHSPTLSSLNNPPQFVNKNSSKKASASKALSWFSGFAPRSDAERLGVKLVRHFNRARLICFHLRFLVLLFLPSLYFFVSNPSRFFLLNFLFVLAFSITLLVSLNLALPRFPSLRLFLARSLPNHFSSFSSPPKASKRVVWSIGSKQNSEKQASSGSWVQMYSNGDVYEGEFHRGQCSGSGVYIYHMKGRYEGDWVDGKYDGYGVETWARGSRYRGQYRQGMRHGIGVYRFYTGDVYAGEWSNGQCHGCGVHTCDDGSRYVGEFKWGVKHGLGHYHFRNGDVYAGEYFGDKMHGFGVYQFSNGHHYEGAWHEGKREGLGRYTFRNGETQSGHWQNGVLNVQCSENTDLQSPYAVTLAKVLNNVQEAQRAAEKAYDLAKIDDRVNKAVAAANKAANAARVAAIKAVQKQSHLNSSDELVTTIV